MRGDVDLVEGAAGDVGEQFGWDREAGAERARLRRPARCRRAAPASASGRARRCRTGPSRSARGLRRSTWRAISSLPTRPKIARPLASPPSAGSSTACVTLPFFGVAVRLPFRIRPKTWSRSTRSPRCRRTARPRRSRSRRSPGRRRRSRRCGGARGGTEGRSARPGAAALARPPALRGGGASASGAARAGGGAPGGRRGGGAARAGGASSAASASRTSARTSSTLMPFSAAMSS